MCDSSLPVDLNTARELIRLSELYIDGTVKLSTALDQRAMQMAAMSATASSALLLFGLNQPAPLSLYLILPAFAAAAMFFFVATAALAAAHPRGFNIAGSSRSDWSDIELAANLSTSLMEQAGHYDIMIKENLLVLNRNAGRMRVGYLFLGATPVVTATTAVAAYCLF